ncbi:MAG: septum formation initiator family protein [SAR324 cluster bacterium]|nr:septum formation initiator family protein [SAR324 cluster bacterium]
MAKLKKKINERKLLQGILLFIGFTIVFLSFFGDKGFIALQKLRTQEAELAHEIQGLQSEREEWEAKVKALKNGTSFYEAIGREKLGLVNPDEIIIQTEK